NLAKPRALWAASFGHVEREPTDAPVTPLGLIGVSKESTDPIKDPRVGCHHGSGRPTDWTLRDVHQAFDSIDAVDRLNSNGIRIRGVVVLWLIGYRRRNCVFEHRAQHVGDERGFARTGYPCHLRALPERKRDILVDKRASGDPVQLKTTAGIMMRGRSQLQPSSIDDTGRDVLFGIF